MLDRGYTLRLENDGRIKKLIPVFSGQIDHRQSFMSSEDQGRGTDESLSST